MISTRTPHEGCDRHCGNFEISIQVPHVGYDHGLMVYSRGTCISTHVPLAGYDGCFIHQGHGRPYFNSRTPRGVRRYPLPHDRSRRISTHVSYAGYAPGHLCSECSRAISTHASHTRCDTLLLINYSVFQLTYPMRGATRLLGHGYDDVTF